LLCQYRENFNVQIICLYPYQNVSFDIIFYYLFFFNVLQSRLALKPDGLFLAAILGGETLK